MVRHHLGLACYIGHHAPNNEAPDPNSGHCTQSRIHEMGECRFNRTYQAYMDIEARLPPLKVLVHKINKRLQRLHKTHNDLLAEICRFKAGDERISYETFPTKISYETLRAALVISGMREPRSRKS